MSFYRFCRVAGNTANARNAMQAHNRFASSQSAKSKSVLGRVLMYGLAGGTVTVGGVVAYADRDPNFKQGVDHYVPGFGPFVDTSSEVYHRGALFVKMGWDLVKPIVTPERGNTGIQPPDYTPPPSTPTKEGSKDITTRPDPVIEGKEGVVADSKEEKAQENESSVDKEATVDPTSVPVTPEVTKDEVKVIVTKTPDPSPESTPDPSPESTPSQEPQPVPDPVPEPRPPQAPSDPSQEPSAILAPDPVPVEDRELETKKISVENELQSLYQDFILKSDNVLASIDNLVQSMGTHYNKIREATDNPPDNETDIQTVSELVGDLKTKVDTASERVDQSKVTREEVSRQLSTVVAKALSLGILEELAEQICDKALEYEKNVVMAEEEIVKTRDGHSLWLKELQQRLVGEREEGEEKGEEVVVEGSPVVEQLPLADLDTQQEMMLLLLRKKIEGLEEEEKAHLAEALAKQQEELQKENGSSLERERRLFNEELRRKEHELDVHYEQRLKEQLYQQADAYSKHLSESLQSQAEELTVQLEMNCSKQLSEKELEYQSSLAGAIARLKGIQSMISKVSETSKSTRKQQSVHAASDTLTSAIITANTDPNPYAKHSISNEIKSLMESAGGDDFITSILSTIPQEVLEEGIASETGLVKRFGRVKRVCKRVALVGEEGGGLGTYLLSYLQSLLTFDMIHDKILSRDPYDIKSMDTYRVLSCAEECLERGDLEGAVRLVNRLTGEARRVAGDWVKEACLYLETRQAVMVVSEYLAASSYTIIQ